MKPLACLLLLAACMQVEASGPRWTMQGTEGTPVRWQQNDVTYVVDAGALSAYVSHDAAVTLVAAAAATWNVPQASLTLQQAGMLAEDVNAQNVYVGSEGPIWPLDVSYASSASRIVVILDADGTLIDMLLGQGASAPSSCRQNAVLEDVDTLVEPGTIAHAMILLNGRCTGAAPEQQLQMQYQLERAFGRVLGLGWSQLNDNVFTGATIATYNQLLNWPIMHPVDVLCGTYSYQCLPNPFQLRPDDVQGLSLLYPVGNGSVGSGKEATLEHGNVADGTVTFPDGSGMAGVNIVARRGYPYLGYNDDYEVVSGVSGYSVKDLAGNVVTGPIATTPVMFGSSERRFAGYYKLNRIPIPGAYDWILVYLAMEPVNPLYVGSYAVGPYHLAQVSPSGTLASIVPDQAGSYGWRTVPLDAGSTAVDCNSGDDGAEASPANIPADGVWSGRFCGYGHAAWMGMPVKAGRTMTVEVTATDEFGQASVNKALPLIGVWSAGDSVATLPTIAATTSSLNGRLNGLTRLPVVLHTSQQLRIGLTDMRGEGRPDFGYSARVLYVDSVTPARLPKTGGMIAVRGMGFQTGNTIMIGSVLAQIVSLSAHEILAIAPAQSGTGAFDLVVNDLKTGGSAKVSGALVYGALKSDTLQLLQLPSTPLAVGAVGIGSFAVQLLQADGSIAAGSTLQFTAAGGALLSCGSPACAIVTDARGIAQTTVLPQLAGTLTLTATTSVGASVKATVQAVRSTQTIVPVQPVQYVAAGQSLTWKPQVQVLINGVGTSGLEVQWVNSMSIGSSASISTTGGLATLAVPLLLPADQDVALQACAWGSVCTSLYAHGVAEDQWRLVSISGTTQAILASGTFAPLRVRVTDTSAHSVQGAPIIVYQTVTGWQTLCSGGGRCATPPVYGATQQALSSDADGMITILPLEYANTAGITKIAISAGNQATLTFTFEKHP